MLKRCRYHSYKKISTAENTILYRCSECGKARRRWRPGHKPAYLKEGV